MIGSLSILALCLLTGGMSVSALAISNDHPQVERNNIIEPTEYISKVNGGTYSEYWKRTYTLASALTSNRNPGFEEFDYESNSTILPFAFSDAGNIDTMGGTYSYYVYDIDLTESTRVAFAYQWFDYYDGTNHSNWGLMRVCVPSNSLINAIEFKCSQPVGVGYGDFRSSNVQWFPPTYTDGGTKTFQNYVLLTSINQSISSNGYSVNSTVSQAPVSFCEYLIYWYAPITNPSLSPTPTFEFHFLAGDGNGNGYVSGYADGYNQGLTEGYQNGYGAGIQVGQSGTNFLNLFGAIADTPVMMIRSLFNFDLFGTSALVIILSLLSALIVLHIIKKVIK